MGMHFHNWLEDGNFQYFPDEIGDPKLKNINNRNREFFLSLKKDSDKELERNMEYIEESLLIIREREERGKNGKSS